MGAVLSTTGLVKHFKIPGQKPIEVLRGVDFSVEPGEKVAIVGPTGCGKTTLINLLLRTIINLLFHSGRGFCLIIGFTLIGVHQLIPAIDFSARRQAPSCARKTSDSSSSSTT